MSILWILAFNGNYIMTVSEFRQLATNINHSYDDMDILTFLNDPNISYIDRLQSIYGYIGSSVPELYKIDVKRILNINI
jgi:hypothetical protein